jgi:predicted metalloendopeptidase
VLTGCAGQAATLEAGYRATENMLGEQLGQLYAEPTFPAQSKAAMEDLVRNLRAALAVSINENTVDDARDQARSDRQARRVYARRSAIRTSSRPMTAS